MKTFTRSTFIVMIIVVTLAITAHTSSAQPKKGRKVIFEYAAKYLCGAMHGPPGAGSLAPGDYRTDVNIHNPNDFTVVLKKKVVQSPVEPNTGKPSQPVLFRLGPDEAFQIDCSDIEKLRGSGPLKFDKGFVIVQSEAELDVVNVMTVKEEAFGTLPRPPQIPPPVPPVDGRPGIPFQLTVTFTVKGPHVEGVPYPVDGASEITTQIPVYLPPECAGDGQPMNPNACPLLDMVRILRDRLRADLLRVGFAPARADEILAQQVVDYHTNPPVFFSGDVSLDFEFVTGRKRWVTKFP
jgi:hypothetical protein